MASENCSNSDNPSKPSPSCQAGRRVRRVALAFVALTLGCLLLFPSTNHLGFLPSSYFYSFYNSSTANSYRGIDMLKLGRVLKDAAMDDKTVILTTLNRAWAEPDSMFDLFLRSFHIGNQTEWLLNHLVVVTLDQEAYARCSAIHPHCFELDTKGVNFSSEAFFMDSDYLQMMWRRIDFLTAVLETGYSFVFTDVDIMWLRNPFPHFYADADFQIACDYFFGNSYDLSNRPNGGFNYVKSNTRTIEFYKFWYYSRLNYPGKHDQDVLDKIKRDPVLAKIGLQIRFLDTAYFGGFCQPSKDFNQVCTMHANCCVGQENKVYDLKILLKDWENFLSLPPSSKASSQSSWSVPQSCRTSFQRAKGRKQKSN